MQQTKYHQLLSTHKCKSLRKVVCTG